MYVPIWHSYTNRLCLVSEFTFFSLQFYGECWSGEDAGLTYDEYGPSGDCDNVNKVGKHWTNYVYRFVCKYGSMICHVFWLLQEQIQESVKDQGGAGIDGALFRLNLLRRGGTLPT
jgi:hypothetical protein